MDPLWRTALWRQFGAAIDMLENALLACPSTLWNGCLWSDPDALEYPTFWSITHHTLFWLDLHLTGSREGFAPPAPFTLDELDPAGVLPEQPYTKEELHAYLVHLRKKCQTTMLSLSDEKAHQQVAFSWARGKPVSYVELLLYSMRHGPRTCGPGFASFSDSTPSRTRRSTRSRERRMKRASETCVG